MKKLFLSLIAFAAFTNISFAGNDIVLENKKSIVLEIKNEVVLAPPATYCQTSTAKDSEGNIVASGTCCRTFLKTPTPTQVVGIIISLKICADQALEANLTLVLP